MHGSFADRGYTTVYLEKPASLDRHSLQQALGDRVGEHSIEGCQAQLAGLAGEHVAVL